MTKLQTGLVLLAALLWEGCQCQPSLPPPPDGTTDPPDPPTGTTALTADTAPPPPCATPEVEPNNSEVEAVPMVLEQRACGVIGEPFDVDYYSFELDDDGWILVELEGDDGSIADMSLFLGNDDWVVIKNDDVESTDASVVFQAPAGPYFVSANEQFFRGGERYSYRLLVSEAKAPVEWTSTETEPNDSSAASEILGDGDAVFGTMDGNGALEDFDWYRIGIPDGKTDLHIDIDAYDFGSGANLTAIVWSEELETLETINGGAVAGTQLDPDGIYSSPGDEIVYVQILEASGNESPAGWYVLNITLEGE